MQYQISIHQPWFLKILIFFIFISSCMANKEDFCEINKPHRIILNKDADVFIGVLLDASHSGSGLIGCGEHKFIEIYQYEALRWTIDRMNKDFGQIGQRIVHNSFIPGVKIGLIIYDTCEQDGRILKALSELFPVIQEGLVTCSEGKFITPIAVLDLTGRAHKNDVTTKLLTNFSIPMIEIDRYNWIHYQDLSEMLLNSVNAMGWSKISAVIENNEHSIATAHKFIPEAIQHGNCISKANISHFNKTMLNPTEITQTVQDSPVVIIIATNINFKKQIHDAVKKLESVRHIIHIGVPAKTSQDDTQSTWGIHLDPLLIGDLQNQWDRQLNVKIQPTPENAWTLDFLQQVNNCTLPFDGNGFQTKHKICTQFQKPDKNLSVIERSYASYAVYHGLSTIINAYKNAWKINCKTRKGVCDALSVMTHEEFLENYIRPSKIDHQSPGNRSPKDFEGIHVFNGVKSFMKDSAYGFSLINSTSTNISSIKQVYKYRGGAIEVVGTDLHDLYSTELNEDTDCPNIEIKDLKPLTENLLHVDKEAFIYIPSKSHFYIGGLFPVHKSSNNGTECTDIINEEAIQQIESFTWAVDQINKHEQLLPDTNLGALILDTCGSKIKIADSLAKLLKKSDHLPDVNQIMAFITAMDDMKFQLTGEILSSINMTAMNIGRSNIHSPYMLQMSSSVHEEAEAFLQILKYIGWDYVSLLVSGEHSECQRGADSFKTLAKVSSICIAQEINLVDDMNETSQIRMITENLNRASNTGASGSIVFLSKDHVNLLRKALDSLKISDPHTLGRLSVMGTSTLIQLIKENVTSPAQDLLGLIILENGQSSVGEFENHYKTVLDSAESKRNPWIKEYREQMCNGPSCNRQISHTSITQVIQGVFSFAAASTQMISHLCPRAGGIMCPGLPAWRQKVILNEFIRNTEVSRVDKPKEFFQFTENFHGNTPLTIMNLRRKKDKTFFRHIAGFYNGTKLQMNPIFGLHPDFPERPLDYFQSSCLSKCSQCDIREPDFQFFESPSNMYILVVLDIHLPGNEPLACGSIIGDQPIQLIESVLWSITRNGNHGNEDFGVIVFDTCQSKEKISRDLTNFFTGRVPDGLKTKVPNTQNIIGAIINSNNQISNQVLEIIQAYRIATISIGQSKSSMLDSTHFPNLITLPSRSRLITGGIASLLKFWDWKLINIVYSNFGSSKILKDELLDALDTKRIHISSIESIKEKITSVKEIFNVWSSIVRGAEEGARIVIALLESPHDVMFLQTASTLLTEGIIRQGDFLYIFNGPPHRSDQNMSTIAGSLVVKIQETEIPEFNQHFQKLNLSAHQAPYTWFKEYWEMVHNCRGHSCYEKTKNHSKVMQAQGVFNTVKSVHVFKEALRSALAELCDGTGNIPCHEVLLQNDYRNIFFNKASQIESTDDPETILEVLNYQMHTREASSLVKIGSYDDRNGIQINGSLGFAYLNTSPIPLTEMRSECINLEMCQNSKVHQKLEDTENSLEMKNHSLISKNERKGYFQVFPYQRFGISLLVPLHQKGKDFFACGSQIGEHIFQNFAAVIYALSEINKGVSDLGLGLIAFDYCDRIERAREQYFSYFAGETERIHQNLHLKKNRIIAALSFDDSVANAVTSILSPNSIPQFTNPVASRSSVSSSSLLSSIPSREEEILMYSQILSYFHWDYVSIVYEDSDVGKTFIEEFQTLATLENICISDLLKVSSSEKFLKEIWDVLSQPWKPKVVILFVEDSYLIRQILRVFKTNPSYKNTILLGGNFLESYLKRSEEDINAITFNFESLEIPGFKQFLKDLTPETPGPLPKEWVEEYYQNTYQCIIPGSLHKPNQFSPECTGEEHKSKFSQQDPFVFHTILAVNTIVNGLQSYVNKRCPNAIETIDCDIIQAELLLEIIRETSSTVRGRYGYDLWSYKHNGLSTEKIYLGKWTNGNLQLNLDAEEVNRHTEASACIEGICLDICFSQSVVYAGRDFPLPIDSNFQNLYGIIVGSLSFIGMVTTAIILLYFVFKLPSGDVSSILGYLILFGCLMIYTVNFSFIFQATIITCTLRRFLMGLSYSVAYASLFTKSICAWKASVYGTIKSTSNPHLLLLITCSLILIQIVLSLAWILIYPSRTDLLGISWRCSPADKFEKELVLSLAYVMTLIAGTIFFCTETWQCKQPNSETRWILLSSLFTTFTWLMWIIIAIQAPIAYKDPSIVVGNLICATSIFLFMYARRFYVYANLKKMDNDFEINSQATANSPFEEAVDNGHHGNPFLPNSTINPLCDPDSQFLDNEISFRSVALPPEVPSISRQPSSRGTRSAKTVPSSRPSLHLSFSDGFIDELGHFESSDEDYIINSQLSHDDPVDSSDKLSKCEDDTDMAGIASYNADLYRRSFRRLGSHRMLVYLTDGNSIGEVSRI